MHIKPFLHAFASFPRQRKLFCLAFILLIMQPAAMAGGHYPASEIREALLQDASAVYRVNNVYFEIHGPGSYKERREVVVTIINENGRGHDVLMMPVDMHSTANFISGEIFNARGESIHRIRRRDLKETSNFESFSLYQDNRIVFFEPPVSTYPYTVRYEYEISYSRGMFHGRNFFPQLTYNTAVEQALLTIEYPADMDVMYRLQNTAMVAEKSQFPRNRMMLKFAAENLEPIAREYRSPDFMRLAPGVIFSTDRFMYDTYAGSNNSWQEFGLWIWQLNRGRDQLPQSRINFLHQLVNGMETDRQKVEAIYSFLQSHTRYVNIALGIGGFQPFDAATVDRTGYGDCKALTNYMMAMLRAVGIESFYTLVYAGAGHYQHVVMDFPVSQFNHVILSVPLQGDTLWLECTDSRTPAGHLGDFTDGRDVLLIREDGGHMVRTPAYRPDENVLATHTRIQLDSRGDGTARVEMAMGGVHFSDYARVERFTPANQQKWLLEKIRIPNYSMKNYHIRNDLGDNFKTRISFDADLRSLATVSGQRITIPGQILNAGFRVPPRIRNRKSAFELKFPTLYADTLVVEIPAGYVPETAMNHYHIETEFGTYHRQLHFEENTLFYVRTLETFAGLFEPEKYADYFSFYQTVSRADNLGIVFVKEDL